MTTRGEAAGEDRKLENGTKMEGDAEAESGSASTISRVTYRLRNPRVPSQAAQMLAFPHMQSLQPPLAGTSMSFFSLSRCVDLVKSPFSALGESLRLHSSWCIIILMVSICHNRVRSRSYGHQACWRHRS